MSEESLTSQDKEELKRRLELLQKEYERTAQRLQRAERREAVRKHVQSTISEQNRLLLSNTSATWEQSSSSSPEQLSNRNVPSDTTKVRFHLPDASPFSTLACTRSPSRAHRLRSKRSRLRLQIRERESDTEESQEKTREGTEERWREERGETASESEWTSAEKDKDVERGRTDEERKQEEGDREKTETLKKNEENLTPVIHQPAAESSSVNQSPLTKLLEVNDPPADQSALRNSPSTSYQSSASDHSNPSNETSSQSCSRTVNDAEKSPGSTEFLTSCTLIEGLPFPVEYYVRTTRRMASAHSSVDLNAVIQSQLSNGRGRRRSSRGRVTSQPSSEKPPDKSGHKKRGPRGRRGRRRARESDSSGQSESLLQSPSSLPQEESEPIPSPKPDSQPHLSRELSPHSEVYPIFRKRRGRAGVSHSQIPASVNDSSHLLPSLTSLAEALRTKDFRSLSGLLTKFDVQDFHLPDEEFGQLKLERLCSSCSNAESVAYNAGFRKNGSSNIPEDGQVENEKVVLDPSPCGASLESSLPLMFTERSRAETGNADQSERAITSQTLNKTRETEDLLYRSITNQAEMLHNRDTQQIKPNDPHTHSASRSLMLNLSMSSTSHTQTDHNTSLISLGATPNLLTASPSADLAPFLLSSDQGVASKRSEVEVNNGTPENENEEATNVSVSPKVPILGRDVSEHTYSRSYSSDVPKMKVETPEPENNILINAEEEIQGSDEKRVTQVNMSTCEKNTEIPKLTNEVLICSETESQHHIIYTLSQNGCPLSQNDPPLSQNGRPLSQNGRPRSQNGRPLSQNGHPLSQNGRPLSQNGRPLSQNDPPLSQNGRPLSQNGRPRSQNGRPLSQNGRPLSQNGRPLSQNDPPLSQNGHPLSQNDPPLSQNDPPLSQNDPPLSQNDPPLSQNDPPLSQNDPPLSQNDPPLSQNGRPLSQNDPPLSQNDPPLSQNDPPLSQNDPPLSQNDPPLSQNDPPLSQNDPPLSQNDCPNEPALKMKTPDTGELYSFSELDFPSQTPTSKTSPCGDIDDVLNNDMSALPGVSANQSGDSEATLNLVKTGQTHTRDSQSQHVALLSCGSLRKTHTLKALDAGCVLDVCLVRWPSDDWCVCVAGEWSVCVWKQKAGVQQWSLLYTWTFTQSVISLQGIPDSSALLCVCLGRLEITEARILYCPSTDSEFSQAELYKGALQAVLAVSDHRVACCSAPGLQQNVQVFTLAHNGRITETLSLVSTSQTIQTLVMVEREKDALIGWTEQKSLLIWNMKSGQLLQTIRLAESVSTATCLRGYSCRGALCVLLQQASACHEEPGSSLFTLIATNPLTGRHFTVRTVTGPSAPTERLIDGDVCESALVGVFQSGLAIWKLTGGVACAYANEPAEVCRLARWAGPNTLLTGYLNGDVNIYQFTPTENSTELKDS